MAESSIFEWLSSELENRTELSRIEARGTIRLVLKDAGLDPSSVRASQMLVVLERIMPSALKKRGINGADELCHGLADELRAKPPPTSDERADTAYDFFERLDDRNLRGPKS